MQQSSPIRTLGDFVHSKGPELVHSSQCSKGDGLVVSPSALLSAACKTASLKVHSSHGDRLQLDGIKPYNEAYELVKHRKYRQAFRLAQATRHSLNLEKELALQRVQEGKIMIAMLHSEAQLAQLKVNEADIKIGMLRAELRAEGIDDMNDDEDILADINIGLPSDSDSDEETAQRYYDLAASPKSDALTEEALRQLDDHLMKDE